MFFQYKLEGAGWARAVAGSESGYVDMPVSYLHDSLRDLASAALALSAGADQVTVTFVDEPGEHHLLATRLSAEVVDVEVRWFDDHPPRSSDDFRVVFRARTSVKGLCDEVLASMRQIVEANGIAGYLAKWKSHSFPSGEFEQLAKVG